MTTHPKSKLEKALERHKVSESEALALIQSAKRKPSSTHKFLSPTQHMKIGVISDEHIGSKYFDYELFEKSVKTFKKEKIDLILNPGDHAEGMSGRPGHIFELLYVGFEKQVNHIVELYEEYGNIPHYGIDGNHDQWFAQKADGGAYVGRTLERRLKHYHHLGEWEGRLNLGYNNDVMLFHANDGTAYATSYKLQKLCESFEGGKKPAIVIEGHYHKAMYAFIRNIHAFEAGTLQSQSGFMRGKKIPAHKGFWILDVWHNKQGIQRIKPEFFPAYQ